MVQLPVVQAILMQFNQMPLRYRPAGALRLARRLVTEAAVPVEAAADAAGGASALDYAALLKSVPLVRSLLRATSSHLQC